MLRYLLCTVFVLGFAANALPPPERSYKILMLLPISSRSQRNVFMPLANALADRGHEVTMLSNHGLDNPKIKHHRHGVQETNWDNLDAFGMLFNPDEAFGDFGESFLNISKKMYDDPTVKMLYEDRKKYDLIVIEDALNRIMYPFTHNQSFIFVSTSGIDSYQSAVIGNFLNPAYVSTIEHSYKHPFSFLDKLKNVFETISLPIIYNKIVLEPAQLEVSKRFPELPPLLEMEANVSLSLMNSHFSFRKPLPFLPNQIEVGGMHCRPAKPLPKDIESFLAGSTPVVYMSLGSIVKSESMPEELKKIFLKAFQQLPYKILWKYEDESFKGLPDNVMIKKWMPQQDILAHSNVKLFITHCGGLSTQEAMCHGTPMVGLPVLYDQPKNCKDLEFAGINRVIEWKELTLDLLMETVKDVMSDPGYQERVSAISAVFKDQLQTPTDRAVFWTEYVIRHKGAVHLRSPELDLSWIELLHLDILLIVHVVLFLSIWLCKRVFRWCFPSKTNERKVKGE